MKSNLVVKTGERIGDLLAESNLTAVAFAKIIGASFSIVSEWVRESSPISLTNLLKIAAYFNCSIDYICGRTDVIGQFCSPIHTFPAQLIELIKNSGKSRTFIFEKIGMNPFTLFEWKNGAIPRSSSLIALADYFDCTIDYLLGLEN